MGDRVWPVPRDPFVAAWNAPATPDEAAARVRERAGGPAPRWAVRTRAPELRRDGVELKALATNRGAS